MDQLLVRVNLGCGLTTPADWINVDGSFNARLAKHRLIRGLAKRLRILPERVSAIPWKNTILIHDVRKPLPFDDSSVNVVYASHLLEHLYLEEGKSLLKECCRVFKPSGTLRIVVPDLRTAVLEYVGSIRSDRRANRIAFPTAADTLNQRLGFRSEKPPPPSLLYTLSILLADFETHKWMYDSESLIEYLRWAGFVHVREKGFRESRIPGIESVEVPERVLGGGGIMRRGHETTERKPTNAGPRRDERKRPGDW
jgi:SAM-dependent methyltransferase